MGWTDDDFRTVWTFIGQVRELLRDKVDMREYADVLIEDSRFASEALGRIADGCCVGVIDPL